MGMLGMLLVTALGAGCEKDTDCKGDRICENGVCVAPKANPAAATGDPVGPPPMPPPQESSRVPLGAAPGPGPCRAPDYRRTPLGTPLCPPAAETAGDSSIPPPLPPPEEPKRSPLGGAAPQEPAPDPCADPLDADGRLKPECKVAPTQAPLRSRKQRRTTDLDSPKEPAEEPLARAVGLVGVMSGALFGGGAAVPVFAFTGAAGVRFRSGVGIVGVAHGRITLASGGSIQLYGLGPGVRFGNRTQLTLALTGTFAAINVGPVQLAGGGLFTILAQVAIAIGDHFTLLAMPTIDFDASGVVGSLSGGLGVTF